MHTHIMFGAVVQKKHRKVHCHCRGITEKMTADKMPLRLNVTFIFNKDQTKCHSEYMYDE